MRRWKLPRSPAAWAVVAIVAGCVGWIGWRCWVWSIQREIVAWAEGLGGFVCWQGEEPGAASARFLHGIGLSRTASGFPFWDDVTWVGFAGSPAIGVDELARLGRLPALDSVFLSVATVGDEHVEPLRQVRRLNWLDLTTAAVTDRGLETVGGMSGLHTLALGGTRVTDEGMRHVARLTGLVSLDLTDTAVSDAGLVHLRSLPRLKSLSVDERVTDAGIDEILRHVQLRVLSFRNSPVTNTGMDRLMAGLPDLQFVHLFYTEVSGDKMQEMEARGIRVEAAY